MGGSAYTNQHRALDVNTSLISRIGSAVAGITAVVYFGLVCLVAACPPALPAVPNSGEHAHHQHEAAHSPLCAWACQAVSHSGATALIPAEVPSLVVLASVVPYVTQLPACPSVSLPPRAPPVSTLG
jgi:hypothetical protein